jgi:uncharacterized protein YqhQ
VAGRPTAPDHLYGGQALLEGVMMRGRDVWAVAVRRPDGGIHVESHDLDSAAARVRALRFPLVRGVVALGQSLSIGFRALAISARVAGQGGDEEISGAQVGISMAIAVTLFLALFIAMPAAVFRWVGDHVASSLAVNVLEGLFRVALFLGYLLLIGRSADVRRTFQYHGAEHQTITAFEHGESLEASTVIRHPTLHVRCGTNFLILVMLVTIVVFAAFGNPGLWWRIGSRLVAIPVIAGVAFELLRLGARFPESAVVRALMAPGLWLQSITTRAPEPDQVEVAIASFAAVRAREAERASASGLHAPERPLD